MIPEQYKTGRAYFMDFEFKVSEDTLIPRPETELLVEKTVETAKSICETRPTEYDMRILDIGTGCGNIAISLTKYLNVCKIVALDISHKALLKTKENARLNGVFDKISCVRGDLLNAFNKNALFDIIVSNPPYVSEEDMRALPEEVLREPRSALYGGKDGLDFYRKIIAHSGLYLKKNGFLIVEIGYDQSERVEELFKQNGYKNIEINKDYSRIDRIIKAQWIN